MQDTEVAQIFINFSQRSVKILDNEGYDKTVNWKWNMEGAAGFSETVADIQSIADPELITYCFAESE
ncbi:hypothetical protein SSSM5_024 [Synechococcus phage S-SSM5]|jgi:hypothetical protein|uniref:Uncharacterized protein n=1 Tax=Synechococcus phage S-SSM5 TaxID=445685 RepID=E3SK66_9CAUD|nr:hypothetical protein SSSM5_024 [Synechococcus phage S-SSM5]ADO98044.1 hypothetical protein SSSM5_024 [Synechococcus phage S-SSM5]|tara:strand:+ start:2718 stop:2918 length:201 start_codon:yes stop_codon:yes gene_type:complete